MERFQKAVIIFAAALLWVSVLAGFFVFLLYWLAFGPKTP